MLGPLQFLILDPVGGGPGPQPPPPIPVPVPVPVNAGFPFTYGAAKTALALRLEDTSNIFWSNIELGLYINEALRFFALCSGYWRERGTFKTSARTTYYDIFQNLNNPALTPALFLDSSMTDWQIIQYIQYHLLENATNQNVWGGTEMFNLSIIETSIQNRLNQFLGDTACNVNHSLITTTVGGSGRQLLDLKTIDVRRAAWWDTRYYTPLWRTDERDLTASASPIWTLDTAAPSAYSVMGPPPLRIQLAPVPSASGALDLLTVDGQVLNNVATTPTTLGPSANLCAAIKWGALADLLGEDGLARDPIRAAYCENMYQLYVQLGRVMPVVLHAEINGVPLIPVTLQEMDSYDYQWMNKLGTPSDLILAAPNLVALSPVPDGIYSVTCDAVREAPIPLSDTATLNITEEVFDMILDYAEHLAMFKVYGMEWHATDRAAQNFMRQALGYNQRISAQVRSSLSASNQSERQKSEVRDRTSSPIGVGSLRNG